MDLVVSRLALPWLLEQHILSAEKDFSEEDRFIGFRRPCAGNKACNFVNVSKPLVKSLSGRLHSPGSKLVGPFTNGDSYNRKHAQTLLSQVDVMGEMLSHLMSKGDSIAIMFCHSKKCQRPRTSSRAVTRNSEVDQNRLIFCMYVW